MHCVGIWDKWQLFRCRGCKGRCWLERILLNMGKGTRISSETALIAYLWGGLTCFLKVAAQCFLLLSTSGPVERKDMFSHSALQGVLQGKCLFDEGKLGKLTLVLLSEHSSRLSQVH